MFKYYFYAFGATLSDYLTMIDFLSKGDVEKGFVVYTHRTGLACLGLSLHDDTDIEPPLLLPQYTYTTGDVVEDELDQPFQIRDALFMSMMGADLIQTKNLAVERKTFAERLGLQLEDKDIFPLKTVP